MNGPSGKDGEELFERYLDRWGYTERAHHPESLNPPKKPDYLITMVSGQAVVEVESFTTLGLFKHAQPGVAMSRSQKQSLSPVRRAITHAAEQLKGIEGLPLVVVLANPLNRPLPLNSPMIISAMYGDLEFAFNPDGDEPHRWQAGRNGRLYAADGQGGERGNHDYVSAVAVVRDGENVKAWANAWWDAHQGEYLSPADALKDIEAASVEAPEPAITLDVFETVSERCVPLPRDVFFHAGDTRWGQTGPGQYGLLATATA